MGKEQVKAYNHQYYLAHKEKSKEQSRRYRIEHREEVLDYLRKYHVTNKQELNSKDRDRQRQLKYTVLSHYSLVQYPKCAHCGIIDIDVLCIDHIDNNGCAHRKQPDVGYNFYNWLVRNNYPEGYQTLCYNCNMKKRMEFNREKHKSFELEEAEL